jgi:hypothetical protein
MSSLIAGWLKDGRRVISEWKRNRKIGKNIRAMRNRLDVSGFERYKNNFDHAQFQARKKISGW